MKKGQGAQYNPHNKYLKNELGNYHEEGIDEEAGDQHVQVFKEHPKSVVNKVTSPDVGMMYSVNPYQGCEHGCVYCYARTTHEYWGFSSGIDFERKIVVKENTPQLLEEFIQKKNWKGEYPITFSGNTDCYQPLERKYQLTRGCLEAMSKHNHTTGFITKNALFLRDIDLLESLAERKLFHGFISLNSLNEEVRRKLEPRTASHKRKLKAIEQLAEKGIPVSVIIAPVIPGLNDHEVAEIVRLAADAGAKSVTYIMVRLNGSIGDVFKNWVTQSFPDRAQKIINQISHIHSGQLNDSRFGTRMRGEGPYAQMVKGMFDAARKKYFSDKYIVDLDTSLFMKSKNGQLTMF